MSEKPSLSPGIGGLVGRIASSAEYSIAAALLVVCVVVGGSLWWLQPQEPVSEPAPVAASAPAPTAAPAADEREAMDDWQRRLGEQFGAIDEQQRRRAAEEQARRERQRAEEAAAAEARRQSEQAARARTQADVTQREKDPIRTTPALPEAVLASPPAAAPRRAAVIEDAAIDWSSCRRPSYPAGSLRRGEEGVVVIAVDLDAAAKIRQARVSQSSGHESLDRVTLEAVQRCRFTPAQEDGVSKASVADVRFTWKIQK